MLLYEVVVVQITLVDGKKIYQTQKYHTQGKRHRLHLVETICQQKNKSDSCHPETTPSISNKDRLTHFRQIICNEVERLRITSESTSKLRSFILRQIRREEDSGQQCKQQCYAAGQAETGIKRPGFLLEQVRLLKDTCQCHHRQQGDGKLGNHQNGSYRSELIVHRNIINKEVRQTHEIMSPG